MIILTVSILIVLICYGLAHKYLVKEVNYLRFFNTRLTYKQATIYLWAEFGFVCAVIIAVYQFAK